MSFLAQHFDAILTLIVGLIGGSLITLRIQNKKTNRAHHGSTVVDQSGARAGQDIVGGNKTTRP